MYLHPQQLARSRWWVHNGGASWGRGKHAFLSTGMLMQADLVTRGVLDSLQHKPYLGIVLQALRKDDVRYTAENQVALAVLK